MKRKGKEGNKHSRSQTKPPSYSQRKQKSRQKKEEIKTVLNAERPTGGGGLGEKRSSTRYLDVIIKETQTWNSVYTRGHRPKTCPYRCWPDRLLARTTEKRIPINRWGGKNDCARTPKSIFCKTVCRKTLGETNTNSKLPHLPDLDSRALIIVIIQLLHCHFRSQLHQFCIFVLLDCLALDGLGRCGNRSRWSTEHLSI